MEYAVFAAAIAVFCAAFIVKGYIDDQKRKKQFLERIRSHYGKSSEKEYKPEIFASIVTYYKKHPKDGQIDDITWNDLDMDRIFGLMDHTLSSAGAEYLYYTLRTPKYRAEEFERMEQQIVWFMEHERDRLALQELFAELGTTGKYSLYDYLDYLDNLGGRSNAGHYLADCFILCSLAGCFLMPQAGLPCLMLGVVYHIASYLRDKRVIAPYIVSLSYLMRLLHICDKLQKKEIGVIGVEQERLSAYCSKFTKFTRNAFLVMTDTGANGSPLDIVLIYLKMIFHLDLIKFNHMIADVRHHEADIDGIVTILGSIETNIAVGAFRAAAERYCIPEFTAREAGSAASLEARQIYHPLIANPVKNDILVTKGVLLTGSNASGKSTFLKTVAVNSILAQTIHCALADCFRTSFCRIYSSMALRDDLTGGDSYYIVEIKALRRILQAAAVQSDAPVLCFVDEVLRGTNTVERIAASTQILKSLANEHVVCFAATHDIELTYLLEQEFDNYHFKEEIEDNDILFRYKLLEGRSATRNAIRLLAVMGYPEQIIEEAEAMAAQFMESKTGMVSIAKEP